MVSSFLASARDTIYALTSCCFPNPTLYINKKNYKVLSLLGEGGYSYVYLVREESSQRVFALKKIRCPMGDSSALSDAMHEVDMYDLFQNEHIIRVLVRLKHKTSRQTDRQTLKQSTLTAGYKRTGRFRWHQNCLHILALLQKRQSARQY
ncbi:hypothetical protein BD408DRAFT_413148 [Parasitella parasitica]|nr:hypothetical protein BD408DRAFT_413148 [Parasitella parasitica]